jgi:hypothetical protein
MIGLPDNITSRPSAFWPFVIADFAFGTLSAIFLALEMWTPASIVLWLGVPPNLYFAFPAFFNPLWGVKRTSYRSLAETVWLRNAGLLIFIITAGHIVAAIDPERFEAVAWLTVGGRLAAGVYWVVVALSRPVPAESGPPR